MRDQVSSMRAKGIQAYQLSEKTDPKEIQEVSLRDESADWDRSNDSSG